MNSIFVPDSPCQRWDGLPLPRPLVAECQFTLGDPSASRCVSESTCPGARCSEVRWACLSGLPTPARSKRGPLASIGMLPWPLEPGEAGLLLQAGFQGNLLPKQPLPSLCAEKREGLRNRRWKAWPGMALPLQDPRRSRRAPGSTHTSSREGPQLCLLRALLTCFIKGVIPFHLMADTVPRWCPRWCCSDEIHLTRNSAEIIFTNPVYKQWNRTRRCWWLFPLAKSGLCVFFLAICIFTRGLEFSHGTSDT